MTTDNQPLNPEPIDPSIANVERYEVVLRIYPQPSGQQAIYVGGSHVLPAQVVGAQDMMRPLDLLECWRFMQNFMTAKTENWIMQELTANQQARSMIEQPTAQEIKRLS